MHLVHVAHFLLINFHVWSFINHYKSLIISQVYNKQIMLSCISVLYLQLICMHWVCCSNIAAWLMFGLTTTPRVWMQRKSKLLSPGWGKHISAPLLCCGCLNYLKGTPNTFFLCFYFHLSFLYSLHPFYPDLSLFFVIFALSFPQDTSRYLTLSHSVLWGSRSCPRLRRPECSPGPSAQWPMKNTSVARGDTAQ